MLNEHLPARTGSAANDKVQSTCAATREMGAKCRQGGLPAGGCAPAGEGARERRLAEEEQAQSQ